MKKFQFLFCNNKMNLQLSHELHGFSQYSTARSIFAPEDYTWFAQSGLLYVVKKPFEDYLSLQMSGAVSGWYGMVTFDNEDLSEKSEGLIPCTKNYYGGTGQLSAFLQLGMNIGLRMGANALVSYEDGSYADFRNKIATIESEISFINCSPTPWSGEFIPELGFYIQGDNYSLLLAVQEGITYPEFMSTEHRDSIFGSLFMFRYKGTSIYTIFRQMTVLNNGLCIGIIQKL